MSSARQAIAGNTTRDSSFLRCMILSPFFHAEGFWLGSWVSAVDSCLVRGGGLPPIAGELARVYYHLYVRVKCGTGRLGSWLYHLPAICYLSRRAGGEGAVGSYFGGLASRYAVVGAKIGPVEAVARF